MVFTEENISGIYKIENPKGEIYIGQSNNIKTRIKTHSAFNATNSGLYESLVMYGLEAHSVSVLHELPKDAGKSVFDYYERVYINQYLEVGFTLLNTYFNKSRNSVYSAKDESPAKTYKLKMLPECAWAVFTVPYSGKIR